MCCRYYIEMSPLLRPIIERAKLSALTVPMVNKLARPLITEGEVRPTDIAPVIALNKSGVRSVFPMVWGFNLPRSSSPLINARIETAAEKPTFKESFNRMRCIIPASYYFEWEHFKDPSTNKSRTGDKYVIQTINSEITWLAGLYRIETRSGIQMPVFTILTKEASEDIKFIHDRMPLIFRDEDADHWINYTQSRKDIIGKAVDNVLFERSISNSTFRN